MHSAKAAVPLVSALLVLAAPGRASAAIDAWLIRPVDGGGFQGMSLDANDRPYVSSTARVAFPTDDGWQYRSLPEDRVVSGIAADRPGRPRVAYAPYDHTLHVAAWDGSAWQDEVAVPSLVHRAPPTIALRPDGRAAVGYIAGTGEEGRWGIYVGLQTDSGWQHHKLVETSTPLWSPSLTVDDRGRVHAAYVVDRDYTAGQTLGIRYAFETDAGWQVEQVCTAGLGDNIMGAADVALDAEERPHVIYGYDWPLEERMVYARKTDTGWETETIQDVLADEPARTPSRFPAFAEMDPQGRLHVAWNEGRYSPGIVYGRRDEQGWQVRHLGVGETSGEMVGMELDSAGQPWLGAGAGVYEPARLGRVLVGAEKTLSLDADSWGQFVGGYARFDSNPFSGLALSPDGHLVATRTGDRRIIEYDLATGRKTRVFGHCPADIYRFDGKSLAFGPAGDLYMKAFTQDGGSRDEPVILRFDGETGEPLARFSSASSYTDICFSGGELWASDFNRVLSLDPQTGQDLRTVIEIDPEAAPIVSFAPGDRREVYLLTDSDAILAHDAETGEFLRQIVDGIAARHGSLIHDRGSLYLQNEEGLFVYDASTGALVGRNPDMEAFFDQVYAREHGPLLIVPEPGSLVLLALGGLGLIRGETSRRASRP